MTDSRLRVLIVSTVYTEPSLQSQVDAFAEHVDVRVAAPRISHVLLDPRHVAGDGCDGRLRAVRNVPLFGTEQVFLTWDLGLARFRPDIVHIEYDPWTITFWQVRVLVRMFSPRSRVIVGSKKNTYRSYSGIAGRIKQRLGRRGFDSAAHVVCASSMTRTMLRARFDVAAASVVPQIGVDTDRFRPRAPSPSGRSLVVGYCGRLNEPKGVPDLIDAVAALRDGGWDVELRLLGAGPLERWVRERSGELPWLTVLPAVPVAAVPAFLSTLDVYVLAARVLEDHEEHDAHALLQAMSCGVPVVATRSGIVPEILGDNRAGRLAAPGDPAALAEVLAPVLADAALRRRLGAAGRSVILARYATDAVAAQRAAVYRRVAEPAAAPASRRVAQGVPPDG